MEFLSGGLYKATIHRVVQPPEDQRERTRLGVIYFAMSEDQVKLVPVSGSPVLEKVGTKRRFEDEKAPGVEAWRKYRTASYGTVTLVKGDQEGVEEEYMPVNGIAIKHYN
jgi:isopenicillin N synthase-like dioxygenase